MARISFLKKVRNLQQVYNIVKYVEDRAAGYGYEAIQVEDGYGVQVSNGVEEFRIVFRRAEDGYVAGGEVEIVDLKFFKYIYTVLRSVAATMYTKMSNEELEAVTYVESEITYSEEVKDSERASKKGQPRQMSLDEVVE